MRVPVFVQGMAAVIVMAGCGGEGPLPAPTSAAENVQDRTAKVMEAVQAFVDAKEKGPEEYSFGEPVFEDDGAYLDVLVDDGDNSRSVRISLGFEAGEWVVKSSTFQQDSDSPPIEMPWKKAEAGTYVIDLEPMIEDEIAKAVRGARGTAQVQKLEFSNALGGPHAAAVKAFLERYKDVYVAPDLPGLKTLFYFADTPQPLTQASTLMEAIRLKREIVKVTFEPGDHADLLGREQGNFEGADYVPNMELIGVFHRTFAPQEGFEERAGNLLGVKDGVCYFPGLTKAPG